MVILVVLFIVVIVIVFSATFTMKEEVGTVSKLRNVYLYLVSFVSLMMILGGVISTVQNLTDVIFPTNYYYEELQGEKAGNLSAENQKKYEENRNIESKKSVAKSIAVVVVALPAFIYHWRKVEKEKNEQK